MPAKNLIMELLKAGSGPALEAGQINRLTENSVSDLQIETSLRIGKLQASLRAYYK